MFERFTMAARAAVVEAQEQAVALGAEEVRAEHVLLGLMADPDGVAGQVLADLGVRREALVQELAVLGNADADALRSLGVDLDAVRRQAEAAFGPGALDRPVARRRGLFRRRRPARRGHIPFNRAAKHALEQSLRHALALSDRHIGAEHLLLGLVDADTDPTSLTLRRLGVSPDDVRARARAARGHAA